MQCEKFETLWNEALDERRAPEDDAQLMAHAAECHQCAELLSNADLLFIGLEGRAAVEPPADLAQRVLADFNRPSSPFARPAVMVALLAMAASIAVAVGLSLQSLPHDAPANDAPGTGAGLAVIKPPAKSDDPFDRGPRDSAVKSTSPALDSLPGLNEDYLAVLRQTGTAVALFPGEVRRVTFSEEPGIVADHIRPVAQPVTAALNALRRTLPGSASEMPGMPDDAKSSSYPSLPDAVNSLLRWS